VTAWWNGLARREQRLLLAGAIILGALILYVWAWEPLADARVAERERVAQQQALLDWLAAVTPVARQMRSDVRRAGDLGGRSLLGLVDETARAAGLAGALSRIEPAGNGEVRVWLEEADFVTAMGWLQSLSVSHPVDVSQLSMERAQRAGQVSVRVTLTSNA
jgi:general secretion pathway protein M